MVNGKWKEKSRSSIYHLPFTIYELRDDALHFVQMTVEEVACALDDTELNVCLRLKHGYQGAQPVDIAELIPVAVDEEDRLVTGFKKTEVVHVDGRADADQSRDARIRDADLQTDARTERETGERDGLVRVVFRQKLKPGERIIALATRFVMRARALPDAAKVDAQGSQPCIVQGGSGAKDHLVVHRAAVQRMWMKHERHPTRRAHARLLQDRFQATVLSGNKKIASRIHDSDKKLTTKTQRH